MKKGERCRECQQWVNVEQAKCICGWQATKTEVIVTPDSDCRYQSKGRRCKLPGSMSDSTRASEFWYCSLHWQSIGDPRKGEEFFNYIEPHYDEIMAGRRDWRRDLHKLKTIVIRKIENESETKQNDGSHSQLPLHAFANSGTC